MKPRALLSALSVLVLASAPVRGSAQLPGSAPPGDVRPRDVRAVVPAPSAADGPLAAADSLYSAGRALDALDLLEAYLGRRPADYGARWRAARSAVALGIMAGDEPTEERWLERGIEHAERAVAARPDGIDGLYWLVASRGWLAMVVGNPARIADLADDVLSDALRLLVLEPGHHGAHHAIGKLHYEVMKLSRFERFLARHLLGVDVAEFASWTASADHLQRAVEQKPEMVLYRLDLGMTYMRLDRPEDARAALRRALALPSALPPDPLFKRRARSLLEGLEGAVDQGPATAR